MSDLVGNPKNRFSHITAHTIALDSDSELLAVPSFELLLTFPFVDELEFCCSPVANRLVHCLATRSCSVLFCVYNVAMLPTSGSPGLQSVNSEHIDRSTFDIVRAGDQLSFRMSRHMFP